MILGSTLNVLFQNVNVFRDVSRFSVEVAGMDREVVKLPAFVKIKVLFGYGFSHGWSKLRFDRLKMRNFLSPKSW